MILMDTRCAAFDKICVDIVWTLQVRMYVFGFNGHYPLKSEHVHSHYTRPPNQIFTRAAPKVGNSHRDN